jgi:hypothetical protein
MRKMEKLRRRVEKKGEERTLPKFGKVHAAQMENDLQTNLHWDVWTIKVSGNEGEGMRGRETRGRETQRRGKPEEGKPRGRENQRKGKEMDNTSSIVVIKQGIEIKPTHDVIFQICWTNQLYYVNGLNLC